MKSFIFITIMLIVLNGFTGCAMKGGVLGVKDLGEVKDKYTPIYINKLPEPELAYIKSANNLLIVTVDGDRKVPFYEVMVGKGIDSIKIKEGNHSIGGWLGVDINIGTVYYKAGHEYFIDYAKKPGYRGTDIHYWIKDITENKIVYGKEI